MSEEPTVYVVDDDERARASVCALVQSMRLPARSFASAEEFLSFYTDQKCGCLVTDVRMLGMSGLELQAELNDMGSILPVIVLTAHATTPVTVRAIQSGAVTLLDKPYREDELWNAIRTALANDSKRREESARRTEIQQRIAKLTRSERAVLASVVAGKPNKVIASNLDISVRTVENRRSDIYSKMNAESLADLVRMVMEADATGGDSPTNNEE